MEDRDRDRDRVTLWVTKWKYSHKEKTWMWGWFRAVALIKFHHMHKQIIASLACKIACSIWCLRVEHNEGINMDSYEMVNNYKIKM